MIKVIKIVINDRTWPDLTCTVDDWDGGLVGRGSLYDTASTNFEPLVTNALHKAVREIIKENKDASQRRTEVESAGEEEGTHRKESRRLRVRNSSKRGVEAKARKKGKVK